MNKRIVYLPGLAADELLFEELQKYINGIVPKWPQHDNEDDLKSYALKCVKSWNINEDDILIGFSFGGMIAKEIRDIVPSKKKSNLFLISSCRNKRSLDQKFINRSKYLKYIPNFILYFLAVHVGPQFTARTDKEKVFLPILKTMAKTTSIDFLKWATEASGSWQNEREVELIQIHGEYDQVIPSPPNQPDHIILNAGHLICYTHAKEIFEIFKEYHNE
jgi:hypothetical protein